MNILIAALYGMVNALALVLYALVAAPEWADAAARWMPATVSMSILIILGLEAFLTNFAKFLARILTKKKPRARQRTRIAR